MQTASTARVAKILGGLAIRIRALSPIKIDGDTFVRHITCVMKTITVREAQHNFAKVLLEVEAGGQLEILRRKKPVARLVSLGSLGDAANTVDWADHRERMASIWKGKPVKGIDAALNDLRGER